MPRLAAGLFLTLLLLAGAESVVAQKVGTTSYQFLKVMPVARATAMGDAYTALASGADGLFWNPAAITAVSAHEVSTTHVMWLFGTSQNALGYAASLGRWGHVGLHFQFTDLGEFEETRADHLGFIGSGDDMRYNPGLTGRTFSPVSWVAGISYARQLTDRFSTGLTAKYVAESLFDQSTVSVTDSDGVQRSFNTFANTLLFDFGMQYNTGYRTVRVGAGVQNFGPSVTFAREAFPAPLMLRIGVVSDLVGHGALLQEDGMNRITAAFDIAHPNDYAQQMHLGLEYEFANLLSLRTGYKINYDSDSWSFGGGINTGLDRLRFAFDYSYGSMGDFLNAVHRLTLGIAIE